MPRDLTMRELGKLSRVGQHRVSRNLYLQVTPTGSRSWLFRYMRRGRARWLGLGPMRPGDRSPRRARRRWRSASCCSTARTRSSTGAPAAAGDAGRGTDAHLRRLRRALHRRPCGRLEERQAPGAMDQHARDLRQPGDRPAAGRGDRHRPGHAGARADLDAPSPRPPAGCAAGSRASWTGRPRAATARATTRPAGAGTCNGCCRRGRRSPRSSTTRPCPMPSCRPSWRSCGSRPASAPGRSSSRS